MRFIVLIVAPLAVASLRVPSPVMSVSEAQAKAAWLAKLDTPLGATTGKGA